MGENQIDKYSDNRHCVYGDPDFWRMLRFAATIDGVSISRFIREAVENRPEWENMKRVYEKVREGKPE